VQKHEFVRTESNQIKSNQIKSNQIKSNQNPITTHAMLFVMAQLGGLRFV
jgi:hypothetical protein